MEHIKFTVFLVMFNRYRLKFRISVDPSYCIYLQS
jgi:hypothetical protein